MSPARKRALAVWGAAAIAAAGAWKLARPAAPSAEDPALLLDRVWIDKKPATVTDYVHAMYFSEEASLAVFQKASTYDVHLELAEYKRDGGAVALRFPQTNKREKVRFSIKACSELPPFDLCLELDQNPWTGPKRYYGMREQEDERAGVGKTAARLRAEAIAR
jgi:hypothetical protein